jgi:hypothetical protein
MALPQKELGLGFFVAGGIIFEKLFDVTDGNVIKTVFVGLGGDQEQFPVAALGVDRRRRKDYNRFDPFCNS